MDVRGSTEHPQGMPVASSSSSEIKVFLLLIPNIM